MSSVPAPAHLDLAVLGTVVRVLVEDPADFQVVEAAWHLCVVPATTPDLPPSPVVNLRRSSGEGSRRAALSSLTQRVTYAAIREQAGRFLMFHAGALSDLESGAAVVYVAPGGTGKTTISARLGPGRGYVTDETVAVSAEGEIAPYPKPLSTRVQRGGKDEVAPGDLGLGPPIATPWVAGLVVLHRDAEHLGDALVQGVPTLDAIAQLSPETSALGDLDRPLDTFRKIIERAGGLLRVTYREAEQLEALFADIMGRGRTEAHGADLPGNG